MSRPIKDAERRLLAHVGMFGSDGYPVHRLGRHWVWGTDEVQGPPKCFRTKREAVASFEAFLDVLRTLLGEEAKERALNELRARGLSEDEIRAAIEAAGG